MTWYQIRSWFWRVAMIISTYNVGSLSFSPCHPLLPFFPQHIGVLLRVAFCHDNFAQVFRLSSYFVCWRSAGFYSKLLLAKPPVTNWKHLEHNRKKTHTQLGQLGCVVSAWSMRGKSKLCRGPTNPTNWSKSCTLSKSWFVLKKWKP